MNMNTLDSLDMLVSSVRVYPQFGDGQISSFADEVPSKSWVFGLDHVKFSCSLFKYVQIN